MKVINLIAGMDWRIMALLVLALIAILGFLYSILVRARKIDLPFMHVFMQTVTRRKRK